jgi:SAM-dependent methyltransferase
MAKQKKQENDNPNWDEFWVDERSMKTSGFMKIMINFWITLIGLFTKPFNKHLTKNKEYLFIELGCGGGTFLPHLKEKYPNMKLHGIDNSPQGCRLALEKLNNDKNSAEIILGDILKNPIKDKKFDISFSFGLIEHFDDPSTPIKAHIDLLKPGGLLICAVPNLVGLQGKILKSKMWIKNYIPIVKKHDRIFGMKQISPADLENWCKKSGLKKVEVQPLGGIFPFFILESYHPEEKFTRRRFLLIMYRIFLFPLLTIINIPFLFRLNTTKYSPYLVATGIKK